MHDVKLRHVETFIEVARQGSVVAAAAVLNVSQPAITKTVRELEAALGAALFEKDGRGIRITPVGTAFLRYATTSVSALRQGVAAVRMKGATEGPLVSVGALPTVSSRIMPAAAELFMREDSGARLRIVTGENAVLLGQIRTGALDIVVGRLAAPDQMYGLSFEHLYSEEIQFVVRPGHPLLSCRGSIYARLADHIVLTPTNTSIIRPTVDSLLIANGVTELPRRIESVSEGFGRSFLRMSDAVWIISAGVVEADIRDGNLAKLPVDTSDTLGPVGLTTRRDSVHALGQILLMNAIRESVTRLTKAGRG